MNDARGRPPHGGGATTPGRWAVLAIGAIAAATVVGPPVGLALTLTTCALFAMTARRRDPWSVVYTLLAAALAAMATLRAADWIVGLSVVASVTLASLAAAGGSGWRQVAAGLLPRPALHALRAPLAVEPRGGWRHPLTAAGIGVVLLAVFVPLFASADAAFAHLLGELVPEQAIDDPVARLAVWLGFALVGGALLTARTATSGVPGTPWLTRIEWLVPLTVLVGLCLLTLAVLASALTRLGLYMDAHGFTRLRLTARRSSGSAACSS